MTSLRVGSARLGAWMKAAGRESILPWRMFWAGLLVRVLYITFAHTYHMRAIQDHFQFGWEMGRIARALVTGYGFADPFNGHSGPTAWTPPLYPLLLAGVFKLFGIYTLKSGWVILSLNSVFSAATAGAVYEIACRSFGRGPQGLKIACWSGWLWALYPAAMQYAVRWVWDMSLTAMLFAWAIVFALRIRGTGDSPGSPEPQTVSRWVSFGVLWGLIGLSNSSLLTFLPACGIWMIWCAVRDPRRRLAVLRNAALGAVCCVAVTMPWIVRNQRVFHAFVPMRANFGAELFQSVQLESQGFPWMATLPLAEAHPEFRRYEQMGELAYSREQGRRALLVIHAHTGLFWAHALKRFYFFWISVPHGSDGKPLGEFIRTNNFAFLSLAGLFGLALALRRRVPGAWLYFWAFALFPVVYYFVTVQARFRHPLEPLICVLGVYLFQSAQPRRRRRA